MVANPGPCSAWTSPPSWLAATKNRTPPVTWGEVSDCTAWLTAPTPAMPVVSVATKLTEPKWYARIALAVAESSTLPARATTNSCPTRWGSVIRASTHSAHDRSGAAGLAAGDRAGDGALVVCPPPEAGPGEDGAPAVPHILIPPPALEQQASQDLGRLRLRALRCIARVRTSGRAIPPRPGTGAFLGSLTSIMGRALVARHRNG